MALRAVACCLIAVGCTGSKTVDVAISLDGTDEVTVHRLGQVSGPVVLLDDGTVVEDISWTVESADVATIEANVVQAVGPGETAVVGEWEGQQVAWTLRVVPSVTLSFDRAPAMIPVGGSAALSVAFDGPEVPVDWSSSDAALASVSDDGVVMGHSDGMVYITATAGAASAMLELQVGE